MSDSVSKYFENANSSNGNIKPIQKDPIVENVKRLYDIRSKVGIDKYNTTLFEISYKRFTFSTIGSFCIGLIFPLLEFAFSKYLLTLSLISKIYIFYIPISFQDY